MVAKIPREVKAITEKLVAAGHEAYLVGGCVRDLLLIRREPKDWDVATDATPGEIQKLFAESVYENQFGTVGVKIPKLSRTTGTPAEGLGADSETEIVEITTFRLEGKYTDKRHPDEVRFAKTIGEDLARRDFTINALAARMADDKQQTTHNGRRSLIVSRKLEVVDPYGGQADLKAKLIRTVGDARKRFEEDALRLVRAVRFATELGFEIEPATARAVREHAGLLEIIAKERIRDELAKMLMAPRAAEGIIMLEDLGLLRFVLPELREGIGVAQNRHHRYTVFDHNVRALNYAVEKGYPLSVRLASLLHDAGKPRAKRGEGPDATFHGHEVVGARLAARALDRLRFPKEFTEEVVHLIRYHMFYYNVDEVSAAGVRRFLARVGPEHVADLLKVREADRIGSDVPKAFPYKLRHLLFMVEKVKRDPIHPKMLALRGDDLMKLLSIPPGPRVGRILAALLEEVIDDPARNTKGYLEPRAAELGKLSDGELEKLAAASRERQEEFESEAEAEMKKKYYVT